MIQNVSKRRVWKAEALPTGVVRALPRLADQPIGANASDGRGPDIDRAMEARLVAILEDERRRIALDLHDGLGQALSLIKLSIERSASQLADGSSDAAARTLQDLLPRVRDALAEVRRVATELRPPLLDDLGILPTLNWLLREFEAACGSTVVEKVLEVSEGEIPAELQITVYRILQEATHNIVQHAQARSVRVGLHCVNGRLQLEIEDDGRGFVASGAEAPSTSGGIGLGLIGMRERAALSGGTYRLRTSPGCGTRICVSWPMGGTPLPAE